MKTLESRARTPDADDADAMAPFLGGMRGLTVFVQDVRNCANKVRDDDATASARERCAWRLFDCSTMIPVLCWFRAHRAVDRAR